MGWFTQWTNVHATEAAAIDALMAMRTQHGYICGRVVDQEYKTGPESTSRYLAQAFFPDCGADAAVNTPDDLRRVMVPEGVLIACRNWESRHAMA